MGALRTMGRGVVVALQVTVGIVAVAVVTAVDVWVLLRFGVFVWLFVTPVVVTLVIAVLSLTTTLVGLGGWAAVQGVRRLVRRGAAEDDATACGGRDP